MAKLIRGKCPKRCLKVPHRFGHGFFFNEISLIKNSFGPISGSFSSPADVNIKGSHATFSRRQKWKKFTSMFISFQSGGVLLPEHWIAGGNAAEARVF
ncbi:MAG: hypothetical protein PHS57_00850 [Alphaproteobacteria bacterium]|nr:hypothetical protein [Alphaproteobacteria bacterium]